MLTNCIKRKPAFLSKNRDKIRKIYKRGKTIFRIQKIVTGNQYDKHKNLQKR